MSGSDDYVYDEVSGEWLPAAKVKVATADGDPPTIVCDAVGNPLADGDSVTLIKDLKVKGANQTLRRGTVIKSIRLTDDPQEIDCRYEASRGSSCARSSSGSADPASRRAAGTGQAVATEDI
jgi:protein PhnA